MVVGAASSAACPGPGRTSTAPPGPQHLAGRPCWDLQLQSEVEWLSQNSNHMRYPSPLLGSPCSPAPSGITPPPPAQLTLGPRACRLHWALPALRQSPGLTLGPGISLYLAPAGSQRSSAQVRDHLASKTPALHRADQQCGLHWRLC